MSRANVTGPTLHIERNGNWWVERPHATGSDIGPAGYARRGERIPDADIQIHVDYYTRAGFHIDDQRAQNMGIKDDKAQEPQSASSPKVAPTVGGVAAPGVPYSSVTP